MPLSDFLPNRFSRLSCDDDLIHGQTSAAPVDWQTQGMRFQSEIPPKHLAHRFVGSPITSNMTAQPE
jgi:hypothetical protein